MRKRNVLNLVVASLIMSDSDEEYFHKSPALALSLYDCVLYKYFDAMFFRAGHVTCSDHTTLDGGALRQAPLRLLDLESLCSGRSDQSDWLYQVRPGLTRNTAMNIYNSTVDVFKIVHNNSVLFRSWKISENYIFSSC